MKRRHPITRSIGYKMEGPFTEAQADALVKPYVAAGTVLEYGATDGFCWFNGPPGEGLRRLRQAFVDLGAQSVGG